MHSSLRYFCYATSWLSVQTDSAATGGSGILRLATTVSSNETISNPYEECQRVSW